MDPNYSIERADGITTIRLHRRLGLDEVLTVIDEVAASDVDSRRLWDLTSSFKFSAEEIRAVAARGREHWPGPARVAYLAADDLTFGLLRMFEVFREQESYETRVFRDEAEARQWLAEWNATDGVDRPPFEPPGDVATAHQLIDGGEANWWKSAEGLERRRQIESEVRSRYEAELELAGWFKGAWLELRIRREIAAACDKATPRDILWSRADRLEDHRSDD